MRFDSTELDPALVRALADKGIETAFPIQELTLEMGIRGQDIIGQARTGTGKTLGFGLPLLHRIDPSKKHIQALIVAPTRELTAQVAEDLQIGSARGLHVTAIYGGVPIDPQFDELKKAHVVVGTPGRLLDHLNRGTMDLSRVTELVLDEADEMLDMGFLPDVERLMGACPGDRHTSLFSATMAPAIVSLARRYMNAPSFLHAKSDEPQTAELVDQHFFQVHRMDKPRLLARIMQQPGREGCYVFTRTKAMADRLVTELDDLGISAIAIHGDLRQATREKNLDKFRDGKADILVATEVAARGLDVDNVTHVVNYDCPDDDKMYLHRIGRTARAGRSGVAVTFAEHNEVDRLNVIRKSVGAFDGDLPQVFSTSKELIEIFDLPEETPWDHLARTSRSGGKGSSSGRSKGSSDRSSRSRRDEGRDGGTRGGRDGGRDTGRDRGRSQSGRKDEDRGRDVEAKRSTGDDQSRKQDRGTERSRTRETGDDQSRTRTRTRTRTRGEDDTTTSTRQREDRTPKGKDDSPSNGRTRARARQSGDAGREQGNRDSARTSDEAGSNGGGRRRARRGRSQGSSTTSGQDNGSSRSRQSGRASGSGRNSGGSGGSGRNSGNRSGGNQSDGNQSGGRGGQSRSRSSRGSSKRQTTSSGRAPTRTTAERPVARGKDARGEGDPRLARRIEVENLP